MPNLSQVIVIPPPAQTPITDQSGMLTPAWNSFFRQILTQKVNALSSQSITTFLTTGQDGIVVDQTSIGSAYTLALTLGAITPTSISTSYATLGLATGTSFNSITGLSNLIPAANSGAGQVGVLTSVSRADHAHPSSIPNPLPVINGGTGETTAFTAGSFVFAGAGGTYQQDNANLYYNATEYAGQPGIQIGPRGSNPIDAAFEFYVSSGVTAHFHNINTAQSITGGVTICLSYAPAGAAVQSGNRVGSLEFAGSSNTSDNVGSCAAIRSYSVENFTPTTLGGSMVLQTVPAGSATLTTGLTVNSDQTVSCAKTVSTAVYTVATLPAGVQGMRAMVSDALAPAFGSTVVGGGAAVVPVFYNGTAWTVG